jgi:polyisoprenoid-binding protein YceI
VTIEVGKSGAFSLFAGHAHQVMARQIAGTIAFDPNAPAQSTVHMTIETAHLEVVPAGEPADDVPKIQETMESAQVLDVARYPAITFASTAIAVQRRTATGVDATVTGDLTLHGQTRPISVPVTAQVGNDSVTVDGRMTVKQTDYGIKPVTVAGVVSVKDTLTIRFTILARVTTDDR